jgi:hypothetical protein
MFDIKLQLNLFEIKKIFPKIKIILGNNAVEPIGVKTNYFRDDLRINFLVNFCFELKITTLYIPVLVFNFRRFSPIFNEA